MSTGAPLTSRCGTGKGRGPVAGRGRQVYELSKLILQKGYAPIIGQGKARWNSVHVHDLAQLFVLLTEAAVSKNLNSELWGANGYYFAENGEHVWGDLSKHIAGQAAQLGFIEKDFKEYGLGKDEAVGVAGFEALSWGMNSRGKAERARKQLGWQPKEVSIEDEVPSILKQEKERLRAS